MKCAQKNLGPAIRGDTKKKTTKTRGKMSSRVRDQQHEPAGNEYIIHVALLLVP